MTIFHALAPLLALAAAGAVLRRSVLREESSWRALDRITFYALIPALIVTTLVDADLRSIPAGGIALSFLSALVGVVVLLGLSYALRRRAGTCSAPSFSSVFQTSTRWNASVAVAVVAATLTDESLALVAAVMVLMMPLVNVLNVLVLARLLSGAEASLGVVVRRVLTNPIIVACGVGLLLSALEIDPPRAIDTALGAAGAASIPLVLLSVGAALDVDVLGRPDADVVTSCAMKLVVFPAIVLAALQLFEMAEPLAAAAIVCAAVPTAGNGYILAREMGGDAPLYARIATVQTALAMVTLPLWLAIA